MVARAPIVNVAAAGSTQNANGTQMRSTSSFDIPLRSASATASSAPPTSIHRRRSRKRTQPSTTAGPRSRAKMTRSATNAYEYGRMLATPSTSTRGASPDMPAR